MKELFSKPWSTAEFLDGTSKERACTGRENMDAQKYIWRSCNSFLVEERHIVDMCVVLTKSNPYLFLQLHDGWCKLVIEIDLTKPD